MARWWKDSDISDALNEKIFRTDISLQQAVDFILSDIKTHGSRITMSEENYLHCSIKLGETTVTFFLEPLKKYQNQQDSQFVGSFVKIENRFVHIESTHAIFEYPNI